MYVENILCFLVLVVGYTNAQHEKITAALNSSSLSESFFVFDVTSDAKVNRLKAAIPTDDLLYSFKEIGVNRYLFVVLESENSAKISFPSGSQVTSYPVEHASEYFTMFGVEGWESTDRPNLLDTNLKFLKSHAVIDVDTNGLVHDEFIRTLGNSFKTVVQTFPGLEFVEVGHVPFTMFHFVNFDDNVMQKMLQAYDTAAGPGKYQMNMVKIIKV